MLTDPQNEKLGIMDEVRKAFKGKHIILPPVKYDTGQTVEDFDLKLLKNFKSPWIQSHLNAVKDANGEIDYIVNTYVDITDLKEAKKILGKSEERYRHLMEHSPLSIAIFTEDGKLNQVNAAWKNLWGLSEEETLQVMQNYNIFTDKQIEDNGHAPLVVSAFKGEDIIMPPMEYEGAITTKEMALEDIKAQSRWIQSHLYSVQHANGDLDYVVNINMDLTELKQAEKETQQQRDVIARIDRASSMGQLTGSIAHELNQPLTGILSNAQAAELMLKNKPCDETEIKEILAEIISDTKRAGDLIRNLRRLYQNQRIRLERLRPFLTMLR
jgi:PAS domain-containing protein